MFKAQKYTQFGDIAICYQPDTETVKAASNMKVFQYMAMGSVPVVSRVGDLPVYVRNGAAGAIVPAADHVALGETIIKLLSDNRRRRSIATTGRRLAETDYSWPKIGTMLAGFISGVIISAAPTREEVSHA
jgi:glycosyltransferase involved in cell wall biosynthesis